MNDENDDMPIDSDLDLLESYLDDALPPAGTAALLARLSADAELSALLSELRSQRALRAAVWASMEPDDRTVEQLCWRVRGAVAAELSPVVTGRPQWWSFTPDPFRVARFTSAAAACVLLGFFGGRLGRGPAPESSVASSGMVSPADGTHGFTQIAPASAVADGPVEVPITDEYGRFVATQRFPDAEQARRFLDDLRRTHEAPAAATADGQTRTVSELRY
jgi:anti-sigma factor RsiW